jgi:DNA-binding response OmpR family regulator
MMAPILCVDDDKDILEALSEMLEAAGYPVLLALTGYDALALAISKKPSLILLDLVLPDIPGEEVCHRLKSHAPTAGIPVIMLTVKSEESDKVIGFETGADDYVTKPFSPKEVMARIHAVTKRASQNRTGNDVLKFEGLEVDMLGRNVYVDGEKAELTPKEYELLFYLVRNKGIALTREKLLYDVWGFDFYGDDRTVDTHIKMLRGNLKQYRKFIVTLRGHGYKFEE